MTFIWNINVISLKVAGFNNPLKRRRLRQAVWNVVCYQETHIRKQEGKYLKEVFTGQVFHAPPSKKKRGVLIGISKAFEWQNLELYVEPEEQFIIIKCLMLGMTWTLAINKEWT